jgi:arylsulfatase A-like enzyme
MVTPNIDRIASEGVVFKRTFCQQPLCGPSRSSFLTGLRPDTSKIWDNYTPVRKQVPDVVTLPQHFKNNGYHTQAVGKISHTHGEVTEDEPSWSVPHWQVKASMRYASEELRKQYEERRAEGIMGSVRLGPRFEKADVPDNAYADGMVADRAVEVLKEIAEKNFFLAVGFKKPHRPYAAPAKYWDLYDPKKIKLPPNSELPLNVPEIALKDSGGEGEDDEDDNEEEKNARGMRPKEQRTHLHGYYSCVSFVDALVGKIVGELDRLGLRENTVVVVTSDHGFHIGENGQRAKSTLFTPSLHVPLVIRTPDASMAGRRTPALTELVDLYPSLCDLCGLTPPPHVEGTSFKPVMQDPDREWKQFALSQTPREEGKVMGYSMRTDRYRFNKWQWLDGSRVEYELYDQRKDPGETVNIAGENAELVRRLDKTLSAGWRSAAPA